MDVSTCRLRRINSAVSCAAFAFISRNLNDTKHTNNVKNNNNSTFYLSLRFEQPFVLFLLVFDLLLPLLLLAFDRFSLLFQLSLLPLDVARVDTRRL